MKSPHSQRPDDEAREQTEEFIAKYARSASAGERVDDRRRAGQGLAPGAITT